MSSQPNNLQEKDAPIAGTETSSRAAAPLRVVHIIGHLGPAGGMEKGVLTLIRNSSPEFEHVVISIRGAHPDAEDLLPPGVRFVKWDKGDGNSFRFIWWLAKLLRSLRPCVVHTRNWASIDGVIAARLAGIRSVVHGEHGWGGEDARGTNAKRRRIRRFLSRWVDTVTCVSKDIERWLAQDVRVKSAVRQIYNGVDTGRYRDDDAAGEREARDVRAELGLAPYAPVAGIVARLDPIKDHATLFRALARVRERLPDARLLCIGSGFPHEEERIRAMAGDGVDFLGMRTDVPRLLRAMDVFVLPSHNEGISNTILEAMACGLPVVASRVGGNPELVVDGETGRLFEAGDAETLANLMAGYLTDADLRHAHGRAGRERVLEVFGIGRMVESYEEVWRACARRAGH